MKPANEAVVAQLGNFIYERDFRPARVLRRDSASAILPRGTARSLVELCMSRHHRPWPMKWIALVILVIIGPYTFLRWHYRKPNPAFQPYQDIKNQANTQRLLSAGFQRIPLNAERPTEPLRKVTSAPMTAANGGLPASLSSTLVETPLLPTEISAVTAAAETSAMFAYPIEFTCGLPDNRQQLSAAYLYVREDEMIVVPDFERLSGELLARNRENTIRVTVPAGTLRPGRYAISLIGQRSSKAWSLLVK
ncbi:MAG: hypothetical protein ABIV50_06875 [Opitutus sp.]